MKKIILVLILIVSVLLGGCNDEEIVALVAEESDTPLFEEQIGVNLTREDGDENNEKYEEKTENIIEDVSQSFVVYVVGEVMKPGVYELSEGKRIIDAIDMAGGYTEAAAINYLNLASLIADGQMIYVPSKDELKNGNGIEEYILPNANMTIGIGGITEAKDQKVNINTASKEELITLPGVGESKAEKIIAYREQNGKFNAPEDIMQISGIKEGLYNKIKDRIRVK